MKQPLRLAGEPIAPPPGPVVLAMGFRPFFILAALFGAVVMPLWLGVFTGRLGPGAGMLPTSWHAHEMFFGYTGAVLAGFLLTAVRRWSGGHLTAANGSLAALCTLWLVGRILHAPGVAGGWWSALPDVGWLLGTTVAIGRPLVRAGSRRNYGFLVALPLLAVASLGMHLSDEPLRRQSLEVPIAVMAAIMAVVAGRIVPMFTRNALGVESTRVGWIEKVLPLGLGAVVVVTVAPSSDPVAGGVYGCVGMLVLGRMVGWKSLATVSAPLLWILHIGHFWIGAGLLLLGAAGFGLVEISAGRHAITAGAIGSLTLGMMARVSLGHTGRELRVTRLTSVAFMMMVLAGLLRVTASLVGTSQQLLNGAGALWGLSLTAFLVGYLPILVAARVDGKPG